MTRAGARRLDAACSEQGKLPAAKEIRLAERDKYMSERKIQRFMQELDQWTEATIINALVRDEGEPEEFLEEESKSRKPSGEECWRAAATARKPGHPGSMRPEDHNKHGRGQTDS